MTHPNSPYAEDVSDTEVELEAIRIYAEADDTLAEVIAGLQNLDCAELEAAFIDFKMNGEGKELNDIFNALLIRQARKNLNAED